MLARIRKNKQGIVDYLVNGNKSGRELSRDELDERVCIDGDLMLTESIIDQLNLEGRDNNYLHITLSFAERELDRQKIIDSYEQYKNLVMAAYDQDEYNSYAEIHFPKIKSYTDKKTGEQVERFPHVHLVIPKRNLITGKTLEPFGRYTDNIDFHDSIQETVNRTHDLESPYDNQRKYHALIDNGEFISRYKGDTFKGGNRDFKEKLLDAINDNDIRTMADFEKELSKHGDVSKGKAGAIDEYYQIKLPGKSKNIRLKHSCFSKDYIENRSLERPKPTDEKIEADLAEWKNTRSHELKFIHPASPKDRKAYYKLDKTQRQLKLSAINDNYRIMNRLNDSPIATIQTGPVRRGQSHELSDLDVSRIDRKLDQHIEPTNNHQEKNNGIDSAKQTGQEKRAQHGVKRTAVRQLTDPRDGLPDLSTRYVDGGRGRRHSNTKSVLFPDKHNRLGRRKRNGDHQLRRLVERSGKRSRIAKGFRQGFKDGLTDGMPGVRRHVQKRMDSPTNLIQQYLADENRTTTNKELMYYRQVRRRLDPESLLDHFERSHGLIRSNYGIEKREDGTPRIRIDNRAYNVSDFCTKHMRLSWDDTKVLLKNLYEEQNAKREEQQVVNEICFVSHYVTQSYASPAKLKRINESLQVFKHLQNKENYARLTMSLNELEEKYRQDIPGDDRNTIESGEIDLSTITNSYLRQQELAARLSMKLADVVATKAVDDKHVDFSDKHHGLKLFRDYGNRIVMNHRHPDINHVAAAMVLAAEKFGTVKISGTDDFKQQVIDVAVAKDLNIVFKDKGMQAEFVRCKEEARHNSTLDKVAKRHDPVTEQIAEAVANANKVRADYSLLSQSPDEIEAVAKSHMTLLNGHAGTVGYQYIQEAILSLTETNEAYKNAITDHVKKAPVIAASESPYVENKDTIVTLKGHGRAPYMHDKNNKESYYVELSDGSVKWGVGLRDAIKKSKAKIGDVVEVSRVGETDVLVNRDVRDETGKKIKSETIEAIRNEWQVIVKGQELTDAAADKPTEAANKAATEQTVTMKQQTDKQTADKYEVTYKQEGATVHVMINGLKPETVSTDLLSKIVQHDNFLKNFTLAQVQHGELNRKQAKAAQPVSKIYDRTGIAIQETVENSITVKNTP